MFFCNQDINWLISGKYQNFSKKLHRINDIPLHSDNVLDQERIKLFSLDIRKISPAKSKSNYNEVELRGLFFSKFINLQGDENEQTVSKYVDLLKINLDNKKQFIQKNFELDYELYYYHSLL